MKEKGGQYLEMSVLRFSGLVLEVILDYTFFPNRRGGKVKYVVLD